MGNTDSVIPGDGYSGYHVLKVEDNSPGFKAGLQAYFDYIVAINNIPLEPESDTIVKTLQNNQDKDVTMTVYSSKTKNCRDVKLFLDSHWGGNGLLGASIRFCPFEGANENVWHVLEVTPRSPADLAGLKPNTDYIIGADSVLQSRDDFYDLIENNDGTAVKLYVYSSMTDKCREIHLTPNSNWGGHGLLGCDIGYGYLHRIPITNIPDSGQDQVVNSVPQQIPAHDPPSYQDAINPKPLPVQNGVATEKPIQEATDAIKLAPVSMVSPSVPFTNAMGQNLPVSQISSFQSLGGIDPQSGQIPTSSQSYLSFETRTTPAPTVSSSQIPPYAGIPPNQNPPSHAQTSILPGQASTMQTNASLTGMPPLNAPMPHNFYPPPGQFQPYGADMSHLTTPSSATQVPTTMGIQNPVSQQSMMPPMNNAGQPQFVPPVSMLPPHMMPMPPFAGQENLGMMYPPAFYPPIPSPNQQAPPLPPFQGAPAPLATPSSVAYTNQA